MAEGNRKSAKHNGSAPLISKSKFLWGLQCHKLLWYTYNAKDLIPEPDAATLAIFEQGHEVGALAKQMFRGGVEVGDGVLDLEQTVQAHPKGAQSPQTAVRGGVLRRGRILPSGHPAPSAKRRLGHHRGQEHDEP